MKCTSIAESKHIHGAFFSVLVFLALFLAVQTISAFQNLNHSTPATNTITVTGSGQSTMPPDVAKISFTVEHTATTVADAQTATTKQANSVLDFVKGQGVADKDVRTTSYSITPQYSYPAPCSGTLCPVDRTPKVTGYRVAESIQVTLRDLTKVGDFVGGLGKLQVQNVSGPNFTLEDTTAGYDTAREDAITKAKAQATLLAQQLGVHLGKITNFTESSNTPGPIMYRAAAMSAESSTATPNIPAGENTYNASVSITYEIY